VEQQAHLVEQAGQMEVDCAAAAAAVQAFPITPQILRRVLGRTVAKQVTPEFRRLPAVRAGALQTIETRRPVRAAR
jgi:hypothetical protein